MCMHPYNFDNTWHLAVCRDPDNLDQKWHLDVLQISALEFSRERKMMSVLCRYGASSVLFVKGAPESVLQRCTQVCAF